MAHTQAPATSAEVVPDHVVERYEIALAKVQGLLAALGLSTRWVSRISLSLAWKDGRAGDGVPRRMAPELMVYVEDGRKVAEVTVETRSGAFLVSFPGDAIPHRLILPDQDG
ncbi:hypothetical protein ACFWY5_52490 [Nonomuraea sp. NPDC059007]|uniref:hypothetical protein n=1 Tax=Nonomuraea sp. NPDC059007 TaxID=3346692 RepID=UPI0036ABFE11